MNYQHLLISHGGPVGRIQLNRPERANALSPRHLEEIEHAALSFRDRPEVRVVIFSGAGRHFSSGADLKAMPAGHDAPLVERRRQLRLGERAIQAIVDMDAITIAAWQGGALGGGACLVSACDLRIGAEDCFMQYPEVDLGMNLMWKGLPLITALVGPARAKRLVVGNERVHAATLAAWGLLDQVTPGGQLETVTGEWAARYADKPPVAAQMIKRSINELSNALGRAIMHMDVDQNLLAVSGRGQAESGGAGVSGSTDPADRRGQR